MFYIAADLCPWKFVRMVHKDGGIMFYIEPDLCHWELEACTIGS
jgi:NAD-dependent dihydropyrimidine dehydrogenase PreA subunit